MFSRGLFPRIVKLGLGMVENNVGKGENAGNQHFILFPQCFLEVSFPGSLPNDTTLDWSKLKLYEDNKITK